MAELTLYETKLAKLEQREIWEKEFQLKALGKDVKSLEKEVQAKENEFQCLKLRGGRNNKATFLK